MSRSTLTLPLITAALVTVVSSIAESRTLYVASNGVDGNPCDCGGKTNPCRSITCAIAAAVPKDKIVVGPGRYGDLNSNGTLGEEGEETPSPGCGCMLSLNKPITLVSSDGAAVTVIDARSVDVAKNVLIITGPDGGGEFGKPGKGFTVTSRMRCRRRADVLAGVRESTSPTATT
jgi:hypothetical protein